MRKCRFALILINAATVMVVVVVSSETMTTDDESSGGREQISISHSQRPPSTPHSTSLDRAKVRGRRSSIMNDNATDYHSSRSSAVNGSLIDPTNVTAIAASTNNRNDAADTTGISDKDIVLIVVCSAVLLVICLVGVALLVKCNCGKSRRDDARARYQGVLQRDSSANSPLEEQTTSSLTNKDNDAHGHTNMFAQIDEIDEVESCPSSPTAAGKHLRRISNVRRSSSQEPPPEFETKPLLTYTEATPISRSKVNKESSANGINVRSNTDNDGERLPVVDIDSPMAEVRVEIVPSPGRRRSVEVERRMYCRTGLSQSDYSLSSFTSVNPSYHYGNQVGYLGGYYGYPSEVLVIDLGSPDFYADDSMMLLLPPSPSDRAIFPSMESDLDISVRAAKDSGSDDVTVDGTSMVGEIGGGGFGAAVRLPSSSTAMDSGSDLSLDRLNMADDQAYRNDDDTMSEDKNVIKLVTDISIESIISDSYELPQDQEPEPMVESTPSMTGVEENVDVSSTSPRPKIAQNVT